MAPREHAALRSWMRTGVRATAVALAAWVLAAAIPGSEAGGMDGPWLLRYAVVVGFLWCLLPLHLFGLVATLFRLLVGPERRALGSVLAYFVVWFAAAAAAAAASGLADPVFERMADRRFEREHPAEAELLALTMDPNRRVERNLAPRIAELVAGGVDLSTRDRRFGMTAVLWTAKYGTAAELAPMLEAGADLRARAPRPWDQGRYRLDEATALDLAAWSRLERAEKVALLLDAGALPTPQALVGVCEQGDLALALRLAESVDPLSAAEGKSRRCRDYAEKAEHREVIAWLDTLSPPPAAP